MNRLLLFAVLCVAFVSISQAKSTGGKFILDLDDTRCCKTKCLDSKNSKKITDALLEVLDKSNNSLQCLQDLLVIDYMYMLVTYQQWADNIKERDLPYEGFYKLQKYVYEFELCKKECKVFYELRKALVDRTAALVSVDQIVKDDGSLVCFMVSSTLLVLSVFSDRLKACCRDGNVSGFEIHGQTLIIDDYIYREDFHGLNALFDAVTLIVPYDSKCDVRGLTGTLFYDICINQLTKLFPQKTKTGTQSQMATLLSSLASTMQTVTGTFIQPHTTRASCRLKIVPYFLNLSSSAANEKIKKHLLLVH